jgi:hypothetical protein
MITEITVFLLIFISIIYSIFSLNNNLLLVINFEFKLCNIYFYGVNNLEQIILVTSLLVSSSIISNLLVLSINLRSKFMITFLSYLVIYFSLLFIGLKLIEIDCQFYSVSFNYKMSFFLCIEFLHLIQCVVLHCELCLNTTTLKRRFFSRVY